MSAAAVAPLLALAVGLAGCGRGGPGEECLAHVSAAPDGAWVKRASDDGTTLTLERSDGSTLQVPLRPRRVASMLPSITELVAYIAGAEALAAVSPYCDYPPEVRSKPKLAALPVDVEGLRRLAPDLVLCDAVFHDSSLPLLRQHAAAVLALESRSVAHLERTVLVLGEVFGTHETRGRADALVRELKAAVARAGRSARTPPLRVLVVGQEDPLHVLGPGALLDDLLRICGAVNVACDLGRASAPFSHEAVLLRAPDWILCTGKPLSADLRERWRRVPAVRAGRLAETADDLLRPGPRTPAALERLAGVLAGELAPERLGRAP